MLERLDFDQGVGLLVEWDDEHAGAAVRIVVYDGLEYEQQATQLAAGMNVPVQGARGDPARQSHPHPGTVAQS